MMKKLAIVSDIHGNIEALVSVLRKIKELNVEKTYCLGDVVGYNANPEECIKLIQINSIETLMGNHDMRAASLCGASKFNPNAKAAIEWTKNNISENSVYFLRNLPDTISIDNKILLFHGWIKSCDDYIFTDDDARINFEIMDRDDSKQICFFGHTHIPLAYSYNGIDVKYIKDINMKIKLSDGMKYLINPGSVGQPRDGINLSSFITLTFDGSDDIIIEHHRVDYDFLGTMEQIINAGLPEMLASRLAEGR